MARQFCLLFCTLLCTGISQVVQVHGAPFYSSSPFGEPQFSPGKSSGNGRVLVAELDKPIDAVLEAVMELGGNVLFLIPPRDFEKRDPPDLGTGRSYTGQRTAKVMWGQLASNSPSGPGKRKKRDVISGFGDPQIVHDFGAVPEEKFIRIP